MAYVLLHIVTLGILLIIHRCQHHLTKTTLPILPVPEKRSEPQIYDVPIIGETIYPPSHNQKEEIKETIETEITQSEEPVVRPKEPKKSEPVIQHLQPQEVVRHPLSDNLPSVEEIASSAHSLPRDRKRGSLEAMLVQEENGLLPLSAQRVIRSLETLNPSFVASYPTRVSSVFSNKITLLEKKISENSEDSEVAKLQLDQLTYLDAKYCYVNVPGDGNCFFRSFVIGWLSALFNSKDPLSFDKEAEKVLALEFSNSNQENKLLAETTATILKDCAKYPSFKELYDRKILSLMDNFSLVTFLKELSFFQTDANRLSQLGSAENIHALITSQMSDSPEIAAKIISSLIANQPSSPMLSGLLSPRECPLTSSKKQAMLLLELLPTLLKNSEEVEKLSGSAKERKETEQEILHALLSYTQQVITEENMVQHRSSSVLSSMSPILLSAFYRFSTNLRSLLTTPIPEQCELFLFLMSTPSAARSPECEDFFNSGLKLLSDTISSKESLKETLELNDNQGARLKSLLSTAWKQKQHLETLESILLLCDGISQGSDIPQLNYVFSELAKIASTSPRTVNYQNLSTWLRQFEEAISNNSSWSAAYMKTYSLPFMKSLRIGETTEEDKIWNDSICVFFVILQYPSLLKDRSTSRLANKFNNIFQTHLDLTLRSRKYRKLTEKLAFSTLSTLLSRDILTGSSQFIVEETQSFVSSLIQNLSQLTWYKDSAKLLLNLLASIETEDSSELLERTRAAMPENWRLFLSRLECPIHDDSVPRHDERTLGKLIPPYVLLYSFLVNNSDSLTSLPLDLSSALAQFLSRAEELTNRAITHRFQEISDVLLSNITKITMMNNLRNRFFFSMFKKTSPHLALRTTFMHQMEHVDLRQLMRMFNAVNEQAEDEQIPALSNVLQPLAMCQYLADSSLRQTLDQLSRSAQMHGFIGGDYCPENQAEIFVLRGNNHYGALLPKNNPHP
ncbi:peptidase C65 Otubain family protein [Chlamydia ibidis]|uniref:Peptidase C65 Otubain family protein n=2 Tax=Chlamydia ibidis TaxID=1405396 RepID=S7J5N9_9CHLA|nr:peptidase C65 Otubain family protein [Chlamydia ibidis]EQM62993.1 peptidase C65 Otubain family protein [Chlamydia ibidis 10-1398/6]